ncbi:MAG: imidazole glycerol phosphate synthase subunit HisH [Desulfohalobiaceae bacterium]|nr:imidazole glycerol phosphate synthase subunit HisH [Desulfohalobiaceae bacterium]
MIAIVDYEAGNLTSVKRALDYLDIPNRITAEAETIRQAKGIIFPGVGAAGQAMRTLRRTGLDDLLRERVERGVPFLGLCLGSQIVLESTPENDTRGLGLIPGHCQRFHPDFTEAGLPINIPHMGWNAVNETDRAPSLFAGIEEGAEFYFVHAYYPVPEAPYRLGSTEYGTSFCSVLGREGLWAVQFHPEKSGRPGLTLLDNFNTYCREAR